MWCEPGAKAKVKAKKKRKRRQPDRDFKALNRGAVDLGVVTTSEVRSYRNVYDARIKAIDDDSVRRAPLIFPPGMVFGHPPRSHRPVYTYIFYTRVHCMGCTAVKKNICTPADVSRRVYSARCNIYISRWCYDASVRLSVRLSVTEVRWRIVANLGFKFRSHFTAHCGRPPCYWRAPCCSPCCLRADHLAPC